MTTEEKLAIALEALKSLSRPGMKEPHTLSDDFDGDYYNSSGGNADDAADIGRREGEFIAAEIARAALAKIEGEA